MICNEDIRQAEFVNGKLCFCRFQKYVAFFATKGIKAEKYSEYLESKHKT